MKDHFGLICIMVPKTVHGHRCYGLVMSRTGVAVAVLAVAVGACGTSGTSGSDGGPVCTASAGCPQGQVCCGGDHEGLACFSFCVASYQLCRASADCVDTKMVCQNTEWANPAWGTVCWRPADGGLDGGTAAADGSTDAGTE